MCRQMLERRAAEVTKGKKKVAVTFKGHPGNMAGEVFGCAILKD